MPDHERPVKSLSKKIADFIDYHPRVGWYMAAWALLVTSNSVFEWLDRLLHALT